MANERNKILPYALSAIEGVNIQSQEDYSASTETIDGVSTGLANGNNFNKLAKQVSVMSSSLAEFIVNTLAEQTISDTNSIEEISSALNDTILKLIKDNAPTPVIPKQSGITVIDNNNTDITSFNQITENGIYYIYKQLSDGPSIYETLSLFCCKLIVLNIKQEEIDICMQLISSNFEGFTLIPGNIGIMPMLRSYNKNDSQWDVWYYRYGITFFRNNIFMEEFTTDKSNISFPIIAEDANYLGAYNNFMYSATKEQMREQLGIKDDSGDVDKDIWKTYTTTIVGAKQRCKSAMYKIYNREINGFSYRCISIIAVISVDITIVDKNLYSLTLGIPEGIKIYEDGIALKNGVISSKTYSLNGMDVANIGGTAINAAPCYINCTSDRVYPSFFLFTSLNTGEVIQSAVITFQVDALIDDRTLAPTPASISVTKILGNSVTLTFTRGS